MSGPTFTKGPWSAAPGDALVFIECPNVAHVGVTNGDAHAAPYVVYAAPDAGGDPRSNARLIAAAPDMFAALEEFANETEREWIGEGEHDVNARWVERPTQRAKKARAALSKASPSEKGE